MVNNILLKPKYELLNSNFEGYKLSSDPQHPVCTRQIENGIYQNHSQDGTCYLYTRMESLHNHLFNDPFEAQTVYVFNRKAHLLVFCFAEGYVGTPSVVWQENLVTEKQKEENDSDNSFHYSPSVSFPSSSYAITSNGCGSLNILQTGDRSTGSSWLNVKELNVCCGTIISSLHLEDLNDSKFKQEMHCLLLSVTTQQELNNDSLYQNLNENIIKSKASYFHVIYWFTFGFDGTKWEVIRERRVVGLKSLEYLSLDRNGQGIVLLGHDNFFYFVYDSVHPIQKAEDESKETHKDSPRYVFMQDNEEIKLWISVGQEISKTDVRIDVRVQDIKIQVKDNLVFDKKFLNPVDSYATTWTVENGKLEICIMKSTENIRWVSLFEGGDKEGEELFDAALAQEVHSRLAHLTSDQWNANPDLDRPAFNPGQLEECDDASEDLFLAVLDGTTHQVSHSSHLGAVQHLFNTHVEGSVISSFCLRHDVDGVLWDHSEDYSFNHVATFNAFGYVKASKSMAKYTRASPDNSYVAVADVSSHVYIFCQPGSFGGELRNRKSGKVSTTIARQLIISLHNHDQVMGFHCAPSCIFILTKTELFVYTIQIT